MALATVASVLTAVAAVGGVGVSISAQRSAKKRAALQARQAEQVRATEKKRATELAARAEALPIKAAETAAIVAGKKRRKRGTLATGPRGLLAEPDTLKPTLGA